MQERGTKLEQYLSVVRAAQNYTTVSRVDMLFPPDGQLLIAALNRAESAGVTDTEIDQALAIGRHRGENPEPAQEKQDPEYWQAVRDEIDEFWRNRYDPNAPEDW